MPEFIVKEISQIGGIVRREGAVLSMDKSELKREIALGKHPTSGKWISALLNHCTPADEETHVFIHGEVPKKEDVVNEVDRIEEIRAEFEAMGAAYDKRWQVKRLENELVMAKKVRGK